MNEDGIASGENVVENKESKLFEDINNLEKGSRCKESDVQRKEIQSPAHQSAKGNPYDYFKFTVLLKFNLEK